MGLKLLADVLGAFNAAMPQLGFAYRRARSIQITFTNVQSIAIDPFDIGDFLANGDLDSANPFVAHYFLDDDSDAYVISETLVSNALTVTAADENGDEISMDVPAIEEVVGANIEVKSGNSRHTVLTYKGKTPLTFGFKAYSIAYDNGRWSTHGVTPSGGIALAAPTRAIETEAAPVAPVLLTRGGRLTLK